MNTKERSQKDIYEIVNHDVENKEITMVDYVFNHGDGFKGATGTKFQAVSKAEYNEVMDRDNFIEYLIDSGIDLPKDYKRTGFEGLADAMIAGGEQEQFCFDLSHREYWDKFRALGYSEDEYPVFNCVGGGRLY